MRIEVVKQFTFDSAHLLLDYEGKCANLHGHTYRLEIGISGEVDEKGFVMDFGGIKNLILPLINFMDHRNLNDLHTSKEFPGFPKKTTAENMVVWLHGELAYKIFTSSHQELKLSFIRLWETPTSYAEWRLR